MRKNILSRTLSIFFAALIVLGSLTSCGKVLQKKPTTASEVYAAYLESDHDNCKVTGDVTLSAGVSALQFSFDTSLDLQMNAGSLAGTVSSRDGSATMELYSVTEGDKQLLYYKGFPLNLNALGVDLNSLIGDKWYVTESDKSDTSATELAANFDDSLFTNATFEENDGTYIVTVSGNDIAQQLVASLSTTDKSAEEIADLEQTINALLKNATLKLTFDDQCRLTAIYMAPVKGSVPMGSELLGTSLDVTLGLDLHISDFGTVEPIVVPADVVSAAVPSEESPLGQLDSVM